MTFAIENSDIFSEYVSDFSIVAARALARVCARMCNTDKLFCQI